MIPPLWIEKINANKIANDNFAFMKNLGFVANDNFGTAAAAA
jgi:hypothetical protein